MATINSRDGKLYIDFRYRGIRCREQTRVADTPENRARLEQLLLMIDGQIKKGTFNYVHHFPCSPRVAQFEKLADAERTAGVSGSTKLFSFFAEQWLSEKKVEWRESQIETVEGIFNVHLLPKFGALQISEISKSQILGFRKGLHEPDILKGRKLSPSRINHIMTYLRMVLNDAAERFKYESQWKNIKAIPIPRSEVKPFSLTEIMRMLKAVRADYKPYYTVRFFTGLRTGEIDGLPWKNVDFERRVIHVHQALVRGSIGPTKNSSSYRTLMMTDSVYEAMKEQWTLTGHRSEFVFCGRNGQPLDYRNVANRVWYPLLNYLSMERRNPYQTRHTAATLWLAAGEAPEWIARQLGHSNTGMLFKVYSRYIPNLRGRDGAAFERLLEAADE